MAGVRPQRRDDLGEFHQVVGHVGGRPRPEWLVKNRCGGGSRRFATNPLYNPIGFIKEILK
jgi:hypothetical protein